MERVFLDLYREFSEVSEEERVILDALKKSRISLYEVESKSQEGIVIKRPHYSVGGASNSGKIQN
jgi:hypothetical protein